MSFSFEDVFAAPRAKRTVSEALEDDPGEPAVQRRRIEFNPEVMGMSIPVLTIDFPGLLPRDVQVGIWFLALMDKPPKEYMDFLNHNPGLRYLITRTELAAPDLAGRVSKFKADYRAKWIFELKGIRYFMEGLVTHTTALREVVELEFGDILRMGAVTPLDLNHLTIVRLPDSPELWAHPNMQKLDTLFLDTNQLVKLPKGIGDMENLISIYLHDNHLTELPKEIGKLQNLRSLRLETNRLATLPNEIGDLENLKELDLGGNLLTEVPEEIGNLVKLKRLVLADNRLTELPRAIGKLANLRYLYLDSNRLTGIPNEIGELQNLSDLELQDNHLTELPDEIGKLETLRDLNLDNNHLDTLPESIGNLRNLVTLEASNNLLHEIPQALYALKNLEIIQFDNNFLNLSKRLRDAPEEVTTQRDRESKSGVMEDITDEWFPNLTTVYLRGNKITYDVLFFPLVNKYGSNVQVLLD